MEPSERRRACPDAGENNKEIAAVIASWLDKTFKE
jgi:hypothetical protein